MAVGNFEVAEPCRRPGLRVDDEVDREPFRVLDAREVEATGVSAHVEHVVDEV